jgi:hypothetical protein
MSDMQDIDSVVAQPIKNPEGIADDGNDSDLRAARGAERLWVPDRFGR